MMLSAMTLNRATPPLYVSPLVPKEQSKEYAYALIHEIRNPLTNINLAIEALDFMSRDDDQRACLDIIKRSSRKINELVTDLLIPSIDRAQSHEYSMHQLLDEALAIASDRILMKNITVTKAYALQDCMALINRQMMKIALTNIIINAIEAMSSESGQLRIVTSYKKDRYIIEIKDNGIGISENKLTTIFEPYFTDKPGGIGLGLSTTLETLLANHVAIDVRSKEGEGTRFSLYFDISKCTE